MGMVPLFVGMHVRLTATVKKVPLLVREVKGTIVNIQFHTREPSHSRGSGQPIILQYLPIGVFIKLDDKEMQNLVFLAGMDKGVVFVPTV